MNYKYNIYNYNIDSNYKFNTLNEHFINTSNIKLINIEYKRDIVDKASVVDIYDNNDFAIQFSGLIRFNYKNSINQLTCMAQNPIYVNEYITNAPFSILTSQSKGVLLHGSVLIINDKAYAFLAPCGVGKSTLLFSLLQFENVYYFSDDAVALYVENGKEVVYRGSPKIKVNKDVLQFHNVSTRNLLRTSELKGKFYIQLDDKIYRKEKCYLEKVFILSRSDIYTDVVINNLSGYRVMPNLLRGTVGYQNLCGNEKIRKLILSNLHGICNTLNLFLMSIPNNMFVYNRRFIDLITKC